MINIVLFQPEIPQNTGNIVRTCAITGAKLHLIKPFGFSIDNKHLKRAGLDYWDLLDIKVYENFEEFLEKKEDKPVYISTTKATQSYADVEYEDGCYIMFGRETAGLTPEIHEMFGKDAIKLPMIKNSKARSLNLSNCVAIIGYEAFRQLDFPGMSI